MSAAPNPDRARSADISVTDRPDVSFAIACYNAGDYLAPAVASALAQDGVDVEVIIVDDGSSDGSLQTAQAMAERDPRVRVFQTPENGGPGAARNIAIREMRGRWYAVLDSDDVLAPERSRTLIDAAERQGAHLVADDVMIFGDGLEDHSLMGADLSSDGQWIDMAGYLDRSRMFSAQPGLGFLKPMIRADHGLATELAYNEGLRIGEDDELVMRLLADGAKYWMAPQAMYRYRKHGSSISHRLSVDHARRMVAAERDIERYLEPELSGSRAYKRRRAALDRALAFVVSVDQLKARRPLAALKTLLGAPSAIPLYRLPLGAAFRRRFGRTGAP